jgi:hypothetical protein
MYRCARGRPAPARRRPDIRRPARGRRAARSASNRRTGTGRALVFFGVLGFGVAVTTLLTSLGLYGHGPGVLASPVRS